MVTDSRIILARRRNHFSQLLNVLLGVNDVRQTEIQTAKPLVPEANAVEFEMATKKLKSHKSTDINQNHEELIQVRGRAIISEMHTLINSVWNKEELPEEWKESITVPIYRAIKHTVLILVINQLDAQNLFYNKFISYFYMLRGPRAHRQEVKILLYSLWYHHTYRWPSRAQVINQLVHQVG